MAELVMKPKESAAPLAIPQQQMLQPPEESPWPAQMKFIWPIQADLLDAGGKPWHLAIVSGKHDDPVIERLIEAPVTITTLYAKNICKFVETDGKQHRAYLMGNSDAKFKEFKNRKDEKHANKQGQMVSRFEEGFAFLQALLWPDNTSTLVIFEAMKLTGAYFYPAFGNRALWGSEKEKHGIKLLITDHGSNKTKSTTTGNYYPDKNKFRQFEVVNLTEEQQAMAEACAEAKRKYFNQFVAA